MMQGLWDEFQKSVANIIQLFVTYIKLLLPLAMPVCHSFETENKMVILKRARVGFCLYKAER